MQFLLWIKETFVAAFSILGGNPSRSFDSFANYGAVETDPHEDRTAVIVSPVSQNEGEARFGGVVWQARVEDGSPPLNDRIGSEVAVITCKGNILYVRSKSQS